MAGKLFAIIVTLCGLLEVTTPEQLQNTLLENLPLSRSLGFAMNNFGKTLDDARLNREFMHQYQEMMKASRDSFESVETRGEKRIRRIVDDDKLDVLKEAIMLDRRRGSRLHSAVGRRRARSQATRRDKLNSQSLKSHVAHLQHKVPSKDY